MTDFKVVVTDSAIQAVQDKAGYIVAQGASPETISLWLDQIWDAIDSLTLLPERAPLVDENPLCRFDTRQLVIGKYLLLFTVDLERRLVIVAGLRHGNRLPSSEAPLGLETKLDREQD